MSAPPPPLAPLDVLPIYDAPPSRAKPPIITILGVVAIIIAGLSMLASAVLGMIALVMMIQTKLSATMTARGSTRYTATSTLHTSSATAPAAASSYSTGPRGLSEAQRIPAREAFHRSQKLSPVQLERLDQLLAKTGKDIFPLEVPTSITPTKTVVSESGTLGSGAGMANFYLVGSGKVEIYDDRGVFYPSDGAPVRVWADDADDDSTSNALSPKKIDQLLASAQSQAGNKLTAHQLATLKKQLSDPNQSLVLTGGGQQLYVSMLGDGSAQVVGNEFMQIDATGNVINSSKAMSVAAMKFSVRSAASTMTLLDAIFAGLLAVYLLIVGILVLRQNRRARGLQMVFAVLKIPIAILAAIGWMWTIEDANAGAVSPGLLKFWFWTFIAIGLAYPITLLIVLRTRSVREYSNGGVVG